MSSLSPEAIIALLTLFIMLTPVIGYVFRRLRRHSSLRRDRFSGQYSSIMSACVDNACELTITTEQNIDHQDSVYRDGWYPLSTRRIHSLPLFGSDPRIEAGTMYFEVSTQVHLYSTLTDVYG